MVRVELYENEGERSEHFQAIQSLAENGGFPEAIVIPIYEDVLEGLKREAKITNYLSVLASRKVRAILKKYN